MAKQNFLGLVKIVGVKTDAYNGMAKDGNGKLIFAHLWDSESAEGVKNNERFIINANGVEYNIATADLFKSLEARVAALESWRPDVDASVNALEVWKTVVDGSIAKLDTSVEDHEKRLGDIETLIDGSIDDRLDSLETSVDALEASVGNLLKSATISTAVNANNVATVQVDTTTDAGTTTSTSFTVKGDDYVKVNTGIDSSLKLDITIGDIETATVDASGLATAHDVSAFVMDKIKNLEGALVFKGGANSDASLPNDASKGDVYVATADWPSVEADASIESGDLLIRGENKWVVVERNLDGAVTASAVLATDKLVVGANDKQSVKTLDITAIDLSTAIANANSALQGV